LSIPDSLEQATKKIARAKIAIKHIADLFRCLLAKKLFPIFSIFRFLKFNPLAEQWLDSLPRQALSPQ
jgi:hypothetical protein